jgi:hypothetical protein
MEFLRVVKRRSFLSELVYVLLNIGLAASVLIMIWATGTPWLAILLVLISKWRVLAVRPRFWFAHIETNMVDIIVGVSLVTLMYLVHTYATPQAVAVQIILAVLYAAWLLLLKPRARRDAVAVQAAVSVGVGTIALASVSYEWPSFAVVLIMWLIGYASARHVLAAYSEKDLRLLSLAWAFVVAELGWLTFHWTISYTLPFAGGLELPQATLLILGLSFLAERVYNSLHKHEAVRWNEIMLPLFLTLGVMLVLLLFFNAAGIGAA